MTTEETAPPDSTPPEPKLEPAAKEGDRVVGIDFHLVEGKPMPFPFAGKLDSALSEDVLFEDKAAATIDSKAKNDKPHVPPPSKAFDVPPKNEGIVVEGAPRVLVNDRPLARNTDKVKTCHDPEDLPTGVIIAEGTVLVGD